MVRCIKDYYTHAGEKVFEAGKNYKDSDGINYVWEYGDLRYIIDEKGDEHEIIEEDFKEFFFEPE